MVKTLLSIFFCTISLFLQAQSPYELSKKTDGTFFGTALILIGGDLYANSTLEKLTDSQIQALNPMNIHKYERWVIDCHSVSAAKRSDFGEIGSVVLGGLTTMSIPLFIDRTSTYTKEVSTLGFIWLETNIINLAATELAKSSFRRIRPYVYVEGYTPQKGPIPNYNGDQKSFFSGHTAIAASNSFFIAKVFSDYFPDSNWKPFIWALAISIPAWTGTERIMAGKHFPSDVIAGYAFGAACGYLIPLLHKKNHKNTTTIIPVNGINYNGLMVQFEF